jgi:hypothetical protein
VRLVVGQRLTLAEAAQAMALPVARVERLLEEDADQRTIESLVHTHVASAVLRDQFAVRQRQDPTLTIAELARRVGSSQAQVERWLGLRPTASKTDRRGRTYPGRTLDRIPVKTAGRLARAMGCAPHEIDGC